LGHTPAGVAGVIKLDLGRTVGTSGAHELTICAEAVPDYGTNGWFSGWYPNSPNLESWTMARGTILHILEPIQDLAFFYLLYYK
jgi:hypothetical protein